MEENNAWQKYWDEVEEVASKSSMKTMDHTDHVRVETDGREEKTTDNYDTEAEEPILANQKYETEVDNEVQCGKPKCSKCNNKFSCMRNLKEHVRNVHILRIWQDALKPTEEDIKFSAELGVQFSGRKLVQVLNMVRTLKECEKTEVLKRIREAGKEGGRRAAFEEVGVFENLDKQEPYKEAKLEVKVDPSDLNLEDEIKVEPKSDSEETAEIPFFQETVEDEESTEIVSSSCEQNMDEDEFKHDVKVKFENLEKIEFETHL